MIVVIADDITGAAEIAGIAFQKGLNTHLSIGIDGSIPSCDVLVIATDTRSMSEQEAVEETRRLSRLVFPSLDERTQGIGAVSQSIAFSLGRDTGEGPLFLFKKTDSALRGHVMAELSTLMETTRYRKALFLPANPSRGRCIRHGRYEIDGRPIHETDFSFDPEFPAHTSILGERFPETEKLHVVMPDAVSVEDVRLAANRFSPSDTLYAGAADLFCAFLDIVFPQTVPLAPSSDFHLHGSALILSGSTQSKPLSIDIPVSAIPLEVYGGLASDSVWIEQADRLYIDEKGLNLTMPHHLLTGQKVAARLRKIQASVAKTLIQKHRPQNLIIEGGATAFECLQTIGWLQFRLSAVIAPGVVAMLSDTGTTVIMKPGSYPWGPLFTSCK